MTDEEKFHLITSAADEGIQNAIDYAPTCNDLQFVKLVAQLAATKAARRAIEKYEEVLNKSNG
jgi:hypothetical protein